MIFVPEVCVKEFSVLRSEFYDHRQIPETISKKRVVTQGKLFPKAILTILGHDSGDFPETFSNIGKASES